MLYSILLFVLVQANGLVNMPNATALTSNSSLMTNPPQTCNPFIGADALSTSSLQFLQQMQAVGLQHQLLQGIKLAIICRIRPLQIPNFHLIFS